MHPHHRSADEPSRLTLLRFSTGQILEDDFAWAWYGIQSAELFEVRHDGRGEAAKNGADRVCETLLRGMGESNRIESEWGRRSTSWGCMIEWKDRLLVIRESQIYPFKDLSVSLSYLAFLSFSHLPKDPIPRKPRFLSCLTVIRKSDHLKDSESAIEVTPRIANS